MKKLLIFIGAILATTFSQAQWEPDVRLTNDPGGSWTLSMNSRSLAASGDTVHVVWYDNRDGNNEIYYKRSTDGGITWGQDMPLTNAIDLSSWPSISVSGATVHVAWSDGRDQEGIAEIYYKRSMDGGVIWEDDTRLT
jgi:Neuraminidase (sialidase)